MDSPELDQAHLVDRIEATHAHRTGLEAITLAIVTCGIAAACLGTDACGWDHDDGIYAITAKSLAEGRGYRLLNLPGAPLQTKYPIGYPLLLGLCWWIWPAFPANLLAMHGATLLCAGAAAGLTYAYLIRGGHASRFAAAASVLLGASSIRMVYYTGRLLSEMPFALLLVLALWVFDDLLRSPGASRRRRMVSGLVLAAPLLCRSVGIAPVGVFLLAGLRRRSLLWTYPGILAVVLPWFVWTIWNRGEAVRNPVLGYYTDYVGWWTAASPGSTAEFLAWNTLYLILSIPLTLFGWAAVAQPPTPVTLLVQEMIGLIALAGITAAKPGLRWVMLAYLGLIWIWPWPPVRFVVPVALILGAVGLDFAATRCRRIFPGRSATILGLVLVVVALGANLGSLLEYRRLSRLVGYPSLSTEARPGSWARFERLFAWVRARTEPDDVIASNIDPMIFLYTGRRAFRPFAGRPLELFYGQAGSGVGTVADLDWALQTFRARYLIRLPVDGSAEIQPFDQLIAEFKQRDPDRLREVYNEDHGQFLIYEIQVRPGPTTSVPGPNSTRTSR